MINYNTVAIIPARANSKGIIQKNLQKVGNNTLLDIAIGAALDSKQIDLVAVSTESNTIEESVDVEAMVLWRPSELSQNHVQVDEVILFSLRQLQYQDIRPKTLVILQPTSPLRTAAHIDEAVGLYDEMNALKQPFETPDALISVWEPGWPWETGPMSDGYAFSYTTRPDRRLGRQEGEDPAVAIENGAIYIVDAKKMSRTKSFRSVKSIPYYMDKMSSLEVDEVVDLEVAEVYLRYGHDKNTS